MSITSSGSVGAVSAGGVVGNVSTWSVNVKETAHSVVTSATKKGTVVISGTSDWDGSFSAYGVAPPAIPGSRVEFSGYTGADGEDTGGSISGPIIIASASTTVNIGTGEPIKWDVAFSGNGKPTLGSTPVSDSSAPALISAARATVKIDGTATTLNVSQIALTITNAISGGTATSNSEGWLKRFGGPTSATAAITVNDASIGAGLQIGADIELEIDLVGGGSLIMKYVHITDFSGVSVDNSSAEPITFTVNGTWNCYDGSAFGAMTMGGSSAWSAT